MNKKLFLGMFAAAGMLLATSCSNDELDVVQSGNEAQVTFSLAAEGGIATRAISDGTGADLLYYAIFDADGKLITTINGSTAGLLKKENAFPNGSKEDKVEVTLAKGQEYTAVFWAQDEDCKAYTVTAETNGLKVAVDYEGNNNDETRDAFFKAETFKVTGNAKIDIELKRPFAQINVGVTEDDWNDAVASGITISESKVVIKNAATSINLLDGTVSGEQVVEYDFAAIPLNSNEVLKVDKNGNGTIDEDENYKYLSMSYILVNDKNGGASKATLEDGLQFTFKSGGEPIVFDEGLHAVPVQRNWRTNIIGKLLTGNIQFNIVIDERFDDDYNYPEFEEVTNGVKYDAATKTYYLYSVDGLKWLSTETNTNNNQFSGYTVKLTSDVDLNGVVWTPIGTNKAFLGTFDGGNKTISNLTVKVTDDKNSAGLFGNVIGNIKNVKLSNVNISGHYKAGAVVGSIYGNIENCHVDGGKILSTPNSQKNNANNVGGIVGYVSENSKTGYSVTNCTVNNLDITAYRSVGGIAGRLMTGAKVENCVVNNTNVIADMIAEYADTGKESAAGAVVGDNRPKADLSSNTTNNVTVNVYTVENNIATVGTANGLTAGLEQGFDVVLTNDVNAQAPISVNGNTLDGNDHTLSVPYNATSGWGQYALIMNNGGTVKNLTVKDAFRGVGCTPLKGDINLDNVTIDNVTYAINGDGDKTNDVSVTNSTINGWISFASIKLLSFENCTLGKGQSYDAYLVVYGATTFKDCTFKDSFAMCGDLRGTLNTDVTFINCTHSGTKVTADNFKTLFMAEGDETDFNKLSNYNVIVDGVKVTWN